MYSITGRKNQLQANLFLPKLQTFSIDTGRLTLVSFDICPCIIETKIYTKLNLPFPNLVDKSTTKNLLISMSLFTHSMQEVPCH